MIDDCEIFDRLEQSYVKIGRMQSNIEMLEIELRAKATELNMMANNRKIGTVEDGKKFIALAHDLVNAMRDGKKIEAIKIVREVHGLGLKDAKDVVEDAMYADTKVC